MKQLLQMLRTWWRQDRIRVTRSCGLLLSLQVGNRLLIGDDIFVIASRETSGDGAQHVDGDHSHSILAGDPADLLGAELFDEPARAADPTKVEYLLQAWAGEHATAWCPLEDETKPALGESAQCQVARLVVPLAVQESIWLYLAGRQCELWADEIVILPP